MDFAFIKLLNMSITAGYIIIAVIILRFIFRKAPKWLYGIFWGMVGLRLMLPVSINSIFSLIPHKDIVSIDNFVTITNTSGSVVSNSYNLTESIAVPELPATESVLGNLIHIGAYVWLAGIAIMIVYGIYSYVKIKRATGSSTQVEANIYSSAKISTPFILGIIRPKIYVPKDMEEENYHPVISHEKAHIRRKDHWIKPFGYLLLSIYWFNPLVWLAYILLCRDIELACDEAVIKIMGENEKKSYSRALLSCSSHRRIIAACPLAFGEASIHERIRNVLNYKKPSFWIIACSLVVCIVLSIVLLTNPIEPVEVAFPVGTYEFKECLYNNPLSSFYPFDGTGETYILSSEGLVIRNKLNGETWNKFAVKSNIASEFSKKEWDELFIFKTNFPEINPRDYKTAVFWELSEEYRIYKMDDEIWLVRIMGKNGLWSIYNLEHRTAEVSNPAADITNDNEPEVLIPEQVPEDILAQTIDSIRNSFNYYETESVGIFSELLTVDNTVIYSEDSFTWPVPANRESLETENSYGMKFNSVLHEWYMKPGITIKAPYGSDILSVNSGTVISTKYTVGYGNTIVINHGGGYASIYTHCSKILVEEGQVVGSGEIIGLVGGTGWATEPGLFFGIISNGVFVDPIEIVDQYS